MEKKKISEIVKDPNWQKVRQSLIGQWKENPTQCCSSLRRYLGSVRSCHYDKLRIVMNYLTGIGFRTGRIKHICIHNLRDDISIEMNRRKVIEGKKKVVSEAELTLDKYLTIIQS